MTSHLNIMFNVYVISFYLESPDLGKSALVTCKYSQLVNYISQTNSSWICSDFKLSYNEQGTDHNSVHGWKWNIYLAM